MTSLGASFCHREPPLEIISKMKLILAVITTFWINYAVAVPSVELVVPGGTQVPRLQNVTTITCKAREFKSGYLVYIKKQSKEGDPLSLMTNGELDDGFKGGSYEGTHRYTGSYKELSSVENILNFDFHIKITDIEPEDAGTFICEMVNGNDVLARDTTTIVVKVPPTSISMKFTNDSEVIEAETAMQTLHFMPDDTAHFTCMVKGGSPQPSISVMIGEEDVTSQFELAVKEVMKPGTTQGFEASTFTVTLEAMNFLMVPKYNNKMLVCKSPAGAEPLERRFHIKFPQNAPQVTCHTKDQIVLLYQRDVNISCDVEGDISDSYIYWWRLSTKNMSDPSYRILVRSGEKDDSYTSTLEKSDDGSAKMILHFRRIYPQDIRSYYFFASNSFGAHQDHMKLTKDPNQVINGAGTKLLSWLALLLAAAVMMLL